MSLLTCNWDTAKFLIFSGNIFNPLIYYSHLLPFILSFALGLFILINNRKPLISKILISIIIGFLLWLFFDLILWATEKINYIMFFWSMQVLIEPMIYAAALYFMYVFINKKDIGFRGKLIIGLLILPTILLTPTRFSLEYFDFTNCEQDVIEGVLAFYGYFIEIIFIIWILYAAVKGFIKSDKEFRKQIFFIATGVVLFLLSLSMGNIIGSLSEKIGIFDVYGWSIGQYGLFGMPVFIAFLAYSIVKFKTFNVKLIGANILIVALWLLVSSLMFIVDTKTMRPVAGITLVLVTIFGYIFIRSVKRGIEQSEELLVMTKMFQAVNKQLDELNNFKSQFLSFASHQIKAPMAIIKGFAELLYSGSFGQMPEAAGDAVLKIKQSVKNLVDLVNDFLDMRKIEEGKMQFNFEDVDVVGLIKGVVDELRLLTSEKKLDLIFEPPQNEIKVKIDIQKMRQVIVNLIENAIKYTEKGFVRVKVQIESNNVLISVEDSGIGIAKDALSHIFEEFARGKTETVKHIKGTGLGLYIAKQIIKAHNGEIWAESEGEGKGSKFYVRLAI